MGTNRVEREEMAEFRVCEMGVDEVVEEICAFLAFDVAFSECSEELCPALLQILEGLMRSEGRGGRGRMKGLEGRGLDELLEVSKV